MPVHAASLADLADLVPLFSAYLDFYEVPAPEEQVRAFLAERLRQGDSTLFLARDAEARALGFVQLYPLFASLALRPSWLLSDLYVRPEARRQGVGEALMNQARGFADTWAPAACNWRRRRPTTPGSRSTSASAMSVTNSSTLTGCSSELPFVPAGGKLMDHLVLTVIATDHPGLVERIAQCIASHGGNWLESRMSRMAGQFAGILRVAVPAEGYDELVEGLQGLSSHGIRVLLAESGIEPVCNWKPIHLDLVGNDRPGIVRDITRLLAEHGVNLESLSTEVRPAPMSSEPLFHADALLAVPLTLSLDTLRERLEDLADDLMVELVLDAS